MREFFRSFISSFNTSLDLQARALGVTRRRLVAVSLWGWLFLLSLLLLPCGAPAQVGLCGPGKDCKVKSLQSTTARSKFPVCVASRYGTQIVDGDAGVLRLCQLDGGWAEVGGGSASSAPGYWGDAGAGYIGPMENMRAPDGGHLTVNKLRVGGPGDGTLNGQGIGSVGPGSNPDQYGINIAVNAPIDWWYGTQRYGSIIGYSTMQYRSFGTHEFFANNGTYTAAAGIFAFGFWPQAGSGEDGLTLNGGARLKFAQGAAPNYLSQRAGTMDGGSALEVEGPIRWGGNAAAQSASMARCFLSTDGGTVPGGGYRDENNVTCAGAAEGAECIAAKTIPGGQTAGIHPTCYVTDNNAVNFRFLNSDTVTQAPVVTTYSCRCFNP